MKYELVSIALKARKLACQSSHGKKPGSRCSVREVRGTDKLLAEVAKIDCISKSNQCLLYEFFPDFKLDHFLCTLLLSYIFMEYQTLL